jgi:hypothetical protein
VAKTEPRNERALCEAVARFLAQRSDDRVVKVESIDTVIRDKPAVECICHTSRERFALEHTRIESFLNQIGEGKRFAQLLEPLEAELAGKLPGVFFLTVDVGAARVPAADQPAVRAALAEWILANAEGLDAEERTGPKQSCSITAVPAGVPFEVTLHRDCDYDSGLFVMQGLNGDRQKQRRQSIARSLGNKCPKLRAYRGDGCTSVLILESDDISLANRHAVAEATVAELAKRDDQPDIVVWVRTSTYPWKGALIKDCSRLYPDVDPSLFILKGA